MTQNRGPKRRAPAWEEASAEAVHQCEQNDSRQWDYTWADSAQLPDPDPFDYYRAELGALDGRGVFRYAACPFCGNVRGITLNLVSGAFKCITPGCGVIGKHVVDFRMQKYGESLSAAVNAINTNGGQS
jgi:hypothetical protein